MLKQLEFSLDRFFPDEIADLWTSIAEQARREGILSLEQVAEQMTDPFMRDAVSLVVDGTEPDLVRDILETRLDNAILPQQQTRANMVIEGLMALQSGDNPGIIRHKLESFFVARPDEMVRDNTEPGSLSSGQLAERLREGLDQMSFEKQTILMTDIAILARSEGVDSLQPLRSGAKGDKGIASEMMYAGLHLVVERAEPAQIMETLQSMMKVQLEALEKAHRMVIEGVAAVQAGKKPTEIGEMLKDIAG